MRVLVYDCSAGISGDMNLAALIDLGADRDILKRELSRLNVHGEWKLECRRAGQAGIYGTRVDVLAQEHGHSGHSHEHHHRTMADIRRIITESGLPDAVQKTALSIFSLLAEAEARVHGTTPDQVDYINAHGTSTPLNDAGETAAVKTVFGDHAYKLAISSTKSMTGHMLGAAGAVEAMFCAMALHDGYLPATINYQVPDPACDLDVVPGHGRSADVRYAMSNSLGFGGHNGSLLFKRWEA